MPAPEIAGSAAERLARLRALPAARVVLPAVAGPEAVHVVGGGVRDLLLGRAPHELDLVVEGDALRVARRAAARLGGTVVIHQRFGTATVEADGIAFDLAGSRAETYPRPGALPEVRLGAPLRADLARRDFTVNAIGLRLADGELTAWPGALEDLAAGRMRVLHDRSFRDDATRLLRLARYAGRLGFAVEEHTGALARAAVAAGAPATVSGDRMGAELRLLAREPQPEALAALAALGDLGPALLGPAFAARPALVEAAVACCPAEARADLAALAVAVCGAERGPLAARLRALAFPAADAAVVVAGATVERLAPALAAAEGPSDVDAVLRREPLEAAAVAAALGLGPAGAVAAWLEDGRHERLAISGHDLVAAGLHGPAVGAGLAAARAALLDGRAGTAEDQLAVALAAAGDASDAA
jgi:tRNA nucleotidyltransferase (CCA-adding enzyme)